MTIQPGEQFLLGDRGQSEVLGIVLLLGFTILSATSLFVVGIDAVDSHQETTEVGVAENELALLGSKVSEVALGDSAVQAVTVDNTGGSYEVQEDVGSIEIIHVDREGNGNEEPIDEFSLGEVTYTNGDNRVAYQGGGVWKQQNGRTSMVSPPEFHYRHGTLTLPVVNVAGEDQASGKSTIVAQRSSDTTRVYPNPDRTYDDGTTEYVNPIEEGKIKVVVQSEYYMGWKKYFEDRTEGDVTYDSEDQTASVELTSFGDQGLTDLVNGESINIRAADDEDPMDDFTLTLAGDGSSSLNNLDWTLTIDGTEAVHLHAKGSGDVSVTIDDPDSDGEWKATNVYEIEDGNPDTVEIDLMSEAIAEHSDTDDEKQIGEAFNDLIEAEGGEVDLTVEDSPGKQRVDHSESMAEIYYEGDGSVITYLQITENDVKVKFN
ncbi:DUF7289 family protein [Natronococcus wangiae]|uniref:DUF7289 family protein n=1 Tax=Natronococcus wangiae TaxID=3068275 RepID=UPI0027400450|nr:hypothetical protein [Natronococcus sp. AD5]